MAKRGRRPSVIWEQDALLRVAQMYYERDMKQAEIAEVLNRTRQDVSRMLEAAKQRGLVQIRVGAPLSNEGVRAVEQRLRDRYRFLRDAVVVQSHPSVFDPQIAESVREEARFVLAQAASKYIGNVLSDQDVVVVGRGQLVKVVVNGIRLPKLLPEMRIVPMVGFYRGQFDPLDANIIAGDLQRISGGRYNWLPIPAIVKSHPEVVCNLPIVEETLGIMREATVVITSVAAVTEEKGKILGELGVFDQKRKLAIWRELRAKKRLPAGEIGGWMFDEHGREIKKGDAADITWQPIGFGLERMKEMVRVSALDGAEPSEARTDEASADSHKPRKVICVAGLDKSRFGTVRAALEGRLFNVLITDAVTAQELLDK